MEGEEECRNYRSQHPLDFAHRVINLYYCSKLDIFCCSRKYLVYNSSKGCLPCERSLVDVGIKISTTVDADIGFQRIVRGPEKVEGPAN